MDDIFEAVDRGDFADAAFIAATDDRDFVIFADRNSTDLKIAMLSAGLYIERGSIQSHDAYIVLVSEFFAERCAHDGSSNAGRGFEVRFARLPPRGMEGYNPTSVSRLLEFRSKRGIHEFIFVIVATMILQNAVRAA